MVLMIGHLSGNKFWGETQRVREPLCTTSLIRGPAGVVLVDPGAGPEHMPAVLYDQAGLHPHDVDFVFVTHSHGDHHRGMTAFPNATWLMGAPEIAYWRSRGAATDTPVLDRLVPIEDRPLAGLRAVPTPGHTPGTTSILFDWRGQTVAVVGDTVMTMEHFRAREGHTNSIDFDQARASIERLSQEADVIVPGHDNAFVVAWATPVVSGSRA